MRSFYPAANGTLLRLTVLLLLGLVLFGAGCTGKDRGKTQVELGRQIYAQNCASCHGARGEGQPNWIVLKPDGTYPAPPHDSTGHTWHHSDGLIFRIVKNGGASLNIPSFQSGMPAFGQQLRDEEIQAVISYLKTLWGTRERDFQAEVSKADPFPPATKIP